MKVLKTRTGRIRVLETLSSMEIGERWKIRQATLSVAYLRVTCSNYGKAVNKSFTVNAPAENKTITIIRTK